MRTLILLLLTVLVTLSGHAQRTRAMEELAYIMAGSYTSAEQAKADTSYFEIELEMVRIWPKNRDGAWLYVEQAVADTKEKPYRQRVYHLKQVNDSTFTSDILTIAGGEKYYGGYADVSKLLTLVPDSLERLDGCTIVLHKRGPLYVGSTKDQECPSKRSGATYTTSEVVLTSERMVSWDRGWNAEGEQMWGAEVGGYVFLKR